MTDELEQRGRTRLENQPADLYSLKEVMSILGQLVRHPNKTKEAFKDENNEFDNGGSVWSALRIWFNTWIS